jgi:hypothetical protein
MGVCLGIYFNVFTLTHAFGFNSLRFKWNATIFFFSCSSSLHFLSFFAGSRVLRNEDPLRADEDRKVDRSTALFYHDCRLCPHGYFPTTLTAPHPGAKQGCVVHCYENRVITVRECARSQTFPDSAVFLGRVLERYKLIGNAVPPHLSMVICNQMLQSIVEAFVGTLGNGE